MLDYISGGLTVIGRAYAFIEYRDDVEQQEGLEVETMSDSDYFSEEMTRFMELDSEVTVRLKKENEEDADLCDKAARLIDARPALSRLLKDDAAVALSKDDAVAFLEYQEILFRIENMERRALYLQGIKDGAAR